MKDLKALVKNFSPIVKHEEVIIDDFAKNIINQVFSQLSTIFPAWKYTYKTEQALSSAKMQWTKAFNENGIKTIEQIKYGFAHARRCETDFLPSPGKFISWCKPAFEDFGYPSEQQAMRDCIKYRNNQKMTPPLPLNTRPMIIELCKLVDWFMVNSASGHKQIERADKHFNEMYFDLMASGYVEPKESQDLRLPTQETVNEGKSDQQKEGTAKRRMDAIKEVRRKLKTKI